MANPVWTLLLVVAAVVVVYVLWRMSRNKQTISKDPERDAIKFCQRGIDYYVAGRFSALPGRSIIVSGNLLHHAIEMLLKGALCKAQTHSPQQIRWMGHNLKRAWKAFKSSFPDPRLNALDSAVKDLNKFEELRYPNTQFSTMVQMMILKRAHVAQTNVTSTAGLTGTRGPTPKKYAYILEDVDELVKLIFDVGRINPQLFPMPTPALEMLRKDNDHPVL